MAAQRAPYTVPVTSGSRRKSCGKPRGTALTRSSRSTASASSFTSRQARLSVSWLSVEAPMIGTMLPGRPRSQASATCAGVQPPRSAISTTARTVAYSRRSVSLAVPSGGVAGSKCFPVSLPRARGLQAKTAWSNPYAWGRSSRSGVRSSRL